MTVKKETDKKIKKYNRFKRKLFLDLKNKHRLVFDILPVSDLYCQVLKMNISENPRKGLNKLSKWLRKKTTIFGVSCNTPLDMDNLESTEIFDFCERLAAEEEISIKYDFENHEQLIPIDDDTSFRLTFNFVSRFSLGLIENNKFKNPITDNLKETFDF